MPVKKKIGKKLGIALAGGSLRGVAHIGVLQELEKHNIKPQFFAGTSAGSIVASFAAAGYSAQDMITILENTKDYDLYDYDFSITNWLTLTVELLLNLTGKQSDFLPRLPLGLIKGDRLRDWLNRYLKNQKFNQLKLPLIVTATDLSTGERLLFGPTRTNLAALSTPGTNVYIPNKDIASCVRASTAIPAIFRPEKIDKRLAIDGGVTGNIPADVLKPMGADVVVAVDVSASRFEEKEFRNIGEVLSQTVDIMGYQITWDRIQGDANLVIHPDVPPLGLTDFSRISEAIEAGRKAAATAVPKLKELLR